MARVTFARGGGKRPTRSSSTSTMDPARSLGGRPRAARRFYRSIVATAIQSTGFPLRPRDSEKTKLSSARSAR